MFIKKKIIEKISAFDFSIPIIINANWLNAMSTVRSLAMENVQSISLSKDRLGIGLFSNQTIGIHCPDYEKHPDEFIEFMIELGSHLRCPGMIMPTDDFLLEILISFDKQLSQYFIRTYPTPVILDFILDKYNQYLSAKSCGVPVPFTIAPCNERDLTEWPSHLFPCAIKGRRGKHFYKKTGVQAKVANNFEELIYEFKNAGNIGTIVQEFIPGEDESLYGFSSFVTDSSHIIGEFISQKTQQIPRGIGVMRRGISNSNIPIKEQSRCWLNSLNYTGFSYIEYKYDYRDNQYKLIELNARSWLNQFLATLSQVNFPLIMYSSGNSKPIPKLIGQKDKIEWVCWVEEIISVFWEISKRKFNFRKWMANLPKGKDLLFGWGDPGPGLISLFYKFQSYIKNNIRLIFPYRDNQK